MQVDSKNNLILNIKNKTQLYASEEVRKALEEYEKNKIATSQVSFCANHDRDTQEAINEYYKAPEQVVWDARPDIKMGNCAIQRKSYIFGDSFPKWGAWDKLEKTQDPVVEAIKHDKDKVKMELLPPYSLEKIAKVFTFGANKYEDWNYLKGDGLKLSRVYGSCLRHLNSWYKGEELDPETGENHLVHAGCCIMMLIELVNAKNNDDRPKHYVKDNRISNLLDVHEMD
jgi:hypothetical protein